MYIYIIHISRQKVVTFVLWILPTFFQHLSTHEITCFVFFELRPQDEQIRNRLVIVQGELVRAEHRIQNGMG